MVRIISGPPHERVVDNTVFQKTVDYPDESSPGNLVLDTDEVVTIRWDQLRE